MRRKPNPAAPRPDRQGSTYDDPLDDHARLVAELNAAWERVAKAMGALRAMPTKPVAQDVSDTAAQMVSLHLKLIDWLQIHYQVTPALMDSERLEIRESLEMVVKP